MIQHIIIIKKDEDIKNEVKIDSIQSANISYTENVVTPPAPKPTVVVIPAKIEIKEKPIEMNVTIIKEEIKPSFIKAVITN